MGKPNFGLLLSAAGERNIKVRKRVNAQDTSAETKPDLQLEIAHVLLIDVVGYSKLLVNEQIEQLQELNRIVRNSECFRAAETKRQTHSGPNRGWDGATFFPQSGRARAMRPGD